jgi:hypothetical protein
VKVGQPAGPAHSGRLLREEQVSGDLTGAAPRRTGSSGGPHVGRWSVSSLSDPAACRPLFEGAAAVPVRRAGVLLPARRPVRAPACVRGWWAVVRRLWPCTGRTAGGRIEPGPEDRRAVWWTLVVRGAVPASGSGSSSPFRVRACGCRDRSQARAPRGTQCSNWPRFLKPLYDPGRSDFPSPVLASALHAISQSGPSPSARNCGAGAPFAPSRWSLPRPFATMQAPRNPALCPERTRLSWPPSAQSPFARNGCYPCRSDLEGRLEGRYPLVVAHTGSCARPPPSPRLR